MISLVRKLHQVEKKNNVTIYSEIHVFMYQMIGVELQLITHHVSQISGQYIPIYII